MRGSLAEQLGGLYRLITEPDHTPEPIVTNWTVVPANENNAEDIEGLKVERLWDISPSVDEIMRQVRVGQVVTNGEGQIVGIGRLRFSDGTQTEPGMKLTIDGKVVTFQFRVPPGGMLGTNDKERSQRGGEDNPQELADGNRHFGDLFKASFSKPRKRKARSARTGPKTKAEERKWLEDAIVNTAVMPQVKKYPVGFPAGPENLAHLFPGLVKTQTAGSGSMAWQDIVSEREARNEFYRWVDSLGEKDKAVLEAAKAAQTYADVGVAVGQSRQYADKRNGGRKALIAANDNLMAAIKKVAA